ncbi:MULTISPECIES: SDR family oxidoreductase [Amycolatopsis]|uniref:NADP-dependent 3-hydroxy acid dehydrogenase YdfG n=2 Tax=Amycolatopsis TaxID=1813 RepID=A0A1I3WI73_9PSEU|nr:SDR family oxidoreductase [Amycolatopsis sacchari]SFK07228.1 NADP-dependent 3-hydroxy acid dehydrogenase YdfG [Amycolatopsis sacchari]
MKVAGTVAVVTGAAGGIGYAIARRLLEHGAQVVVLDLTARTVEAAVDSLSRHAPGQVAGLAGDCSAEDDLRAAIDLARARFGPVGLFAANAGVALGSGLEASDTDWAASVEVNLLAHVRAARLLVPGWLDRGRGYFLSTASAAGLLTQLGSAAYSVTKHAAVAFAEWLSVTYGSRGIAVSCLCPMGVNTAMLHDGRQSADAVARLAAKAVADSGAVMEPLDVADAVLEGIRDERFLILPHPEVLGFFRHKAADYDRWLAGMRRYQEALA